MSVAESFPQYVPGRQPELWAVAASDDAYFERTGTGYLVQPEVAADLVKLQQSGIDAATVDSAPRWSLAPQTQLEVDKQTALLGKLTEEQTVAIIADPVAHSAGAVWHAQAKRAIALPALVEAGNPEPHMITPGIDPAVYEEGLSTFGGRSAVEVLQATKPHKAADIHRRYVDITTTPINDKPLGEVEGHSAYLDFLEKHDLPFLSSQEFMTGLVDGRAVDTRGATANEVMLNHILKHPEQFEDRPIVTASVACGAAQQVFEFNKLVGQYGVTVGENIAIDQDPMALATALGLGRSMGAAGVLRLEHQDLLNGKLTDYIEPHSVDFVDAIGILDYFKKSMVGYKFASNFLAGLRDIVRPGGMVVTANALAHRPQQAFFKNIWPPLYQRDPRAMVGIIKDAGYKDEDIVVRVPQREGAYGVYGLAVPVETPRAFFVPSRYQRAAQRVVQHLYSY